MANLIWGVWYVAFCIHTKAIPTIIGRPYERWSIVATAQSSLWASCWGYSPTDDYNVYQLFLCKTRSHCSKLQCKLLTCAPLWRQFSSQPRDLGPKKAGTGQSMQIWKRKNMNSCWKTFLTWSPCYLWPLALSHDLSPPGLGRDGHTCCRRIKL